VSLCLSVRPTVHQKGTLKIGDTACHSFQMNSKNIFNPDKNLKKKKNWLRDRLITSFPYVSVATLGYLIMSGQRKKENPLLKSSYSARIDTKSSLLVTSTTSVSKKPKTNAELTTHVTQDSKRLVRLSSQLSNESKKISTPSVKLTGTVPKLSDKYALVTKLTRKPDESSTRELTISSKSEVATKPARTNKLKTTQLQTKSLVLSASKSGLLASKKFTTSSLQTSSKLPLSSHAASGSFVSSSRAISSTRTSVKPTSVRSQPLTNKTSQLSVQSNVQRSRLGALKDNIDGSAAITPHYDLKLERARNNEEDEIATFLPPELDPSIQDQVTPTINILQVRIS